MAESRRNLGFPSNQIKGTDWRYYPGCGGFGAGVCHDPATYSFIYWAIKVNPFSAKNTKLILHNDSFAPYLDTPIGFCAHNAGTRQGLDVLLFHESPAAGVDRTKATAIVSVPSSATFPYEIEFDAEHLPQPEDADYERRIWVALDFGRTGLMTGGIVQNYEAMQAIKLNFEGQP